MSWSIKNSSGVYEEFTGTIITFGAGTDYPASVEGMGQAVSDHGSEDLLCLCLEAGELYCPSDFLLRKDNYNRYFKAMVPGCVIPLNSLYRGPGAYTGIMMFEGFQIGRSVGYYGSQCDIMSATCETIFSKCLCYGPSYYPSFFSMNIANGKLAAYNCTLYNSLMRYGLTGNSTNVRIHRCEALNIAYGTAEGGLENDYVLTPTVGYGYAYGEDFIKEYRSVLSSIDVSVSDSVMIKGQQQQAIAVATYESGDTEDITDSVVWSSSNSSILSVNSSGLVTAIASGTATITATPIVEN